MLDNRIKELPFNKALSKLLCYKEVGHSYPYKKLKIGVDLDEVVYNLMQVWIDLINSNEHTNFTVSQVGLWEVHESLKLKPEQVYPLLETDNLYLSLPILDNACYTVLKWLYSMFDVYIVSYAPTSASFTDKVKSIERDFDFIDKSKIILAKNKHLIDLDILIDDGVHNFNDKVIPILYSQPWNINQYELSNYLRVSSWEDIYNWFWQLIKSFEMIE